MKGQNKTCWQTRPRRLHTKLSYEGDTEFSVYIIKVQSFLTRLVFICLPKKENLLCFHISGEHFRCLFQLAVGIPISVTSNYGIEISSFLTFSFFGLCNQNRIFFTLFQISVSLVFSLNLDGHRATLLDISFLFQWILHQQM